MPVPTYCRCKPGWCRFKRGCLDWCRRRRQRRAPSFPRSVPLFCHRAPMCRGCRLCFAAAGRPCSAAAARHCFKRSRRVSRSLATPLAFGNRSIRVGGGAEGRGRGGEREREDGQTVSGQGAPTSASVCTSAGAGGLSRVAGRVACHGALSCLFRDELHDDAGHIVAADAPRFLGVGCDAALENLLADAREPLRLCDPRSYEVDELLWVGG